MPNRNPDGLTPALKEQLIQQALQRRKQRSGKAATPAEDVQRTPEIPEQHYRFNLHPGYRQIRLINDGAAKLGIEHPYFKVHDGSAGVNTSICGREYVNFSSYNYLGLSGDPRINAAAKQAIDRYGTSVSASRLVSGEREIHRELERALAAAYDSEDAVAMVSGHATNVTVIGHLFGPRDLILHDALVHNSILQGIQLSGAHRLPFPHQDWAALDTILSDQRSQFERVLIVVEGLYSMDGDYPDLPRFIEIKRRHKAFLMVDDAHGFGVMGATGLGIREHFGIAGSEVDIWMGTLSKALAGCGGYIAGETALIEHLKFLAPGFLYSVGMSPPLAAAALAALRCMLDEPDRVKTLQARGKLFKEAAQDAGIDTGSSMGYAILPAITGNSVNAVKLSAALMSQGIHVQPILYPAVPEKTARLRFFINCGHSEEQILDTVKALRNEMMRL